MCQKLILLQNSIQSFPPHLYIVTRHFLRPQGRGVGQAGYALLPPGPIIVKEGRGGGQPLFLSTWGVTAMHGGKPPAKPGGYDNP